MLVYLVLLVLALPIFLLVKWTLHFLYFYKHLKHIPSPPTYPIIGNVMEFSTPKETINVLNRLFERYNTKLLRINFGPRTSIYIKDYDFLEFVLSSSTILKKSHGYTFLKGWLGTGLLTGAGPKWKQHRKIITPTFHFKILEQFVEVFNSVSDILVEKLKKEVGKGSTDIHPFISVYSLDVICETAMGTSVNAQTSTDSLYVKCVKDMCSILQFRTFNPLFHYDFFFRFSSHYKDECRALEVLHGYTNSVIKRKKELLREKNHEVVEDDVGSKKKVAFLDLLLQVTVDGKPISDSDIREEVDTFMFAGHDTTTAAMSFLVFLLSKNQDVQQKIYEEMIEVMGTDDKCPPTYGDLQNLKYMEMAIKEAIRLYPPVPSYIRETTEEVKYKDFTIPKGCSLHIFAYGIHRDPEYFPNPDKFDPERFSSTNTSKYPYAFIPFSAGPRNCIGQKFAMLQMKATLSKLLRNFEIKPVVPEHIMEIAQLTILSSLNGVLIKLEDRIKK